MTLYTLRLAVDDAVLVSEMKRQHKVVVCSRTWSNCRKALAEMAVNGRALKALFEDTRVAEKERAAASRGSSRKCDFTSEYLYLLASAWGVETSLSRRKMPLLMAIITKAVVQEATSRGIERLDELTDEKIAELMPSENTIKKAIEDWQATTDLQNKDDFQAARRVFSVNDAGNKKNWKLTRRLIAAYNKGAGKVILRFIACGSSPRASSPTWWPKTWRASACAPGK